jgi:hypothetical protein
MAYAVPTITAYTRSPAKLTNHWKVIEGKIVTSATKSGFTTSQIERYFRRCHSISVHANILTSAWSFQWKRSATHKYGVMVMFALSTGLANDLQLVPTIMAGNSALFLAVGI